MTARWLLTAIALIAVLGCRGGNAQQDDLAALVGQCKADAAKQAGVDVAEVKVTKAESVVWRDGSLGCPKPGMDYIMMLIPGYRMTLEAGGKSYEYHTDKGKRFVLCEGGGQEPYQVGGPVEVPGGGGASAVGQAGVLFLEPIPNEPNLNSKLVLMDVAGDKQTVIEACTAFTTSVDGWVLAKARTSRSGHDLLLARVGQAPKVVMKAFDFDAMAFDRGGSRYGVLVRSVVGQPYRLHIGGPEGEPQPLDWAPTVQRGSAARISLVSDLLLLVEGGSDDDAPKVTVLDLTAEKVVATFRSTSAELFAPESVRAFDRNVTY